MSESLTHENFADHLQERFEIVLDDGRIACELTECALLRDGNPPAEGRRQPFSLIFVGPADPLLSQATYRLEHQELGRLDLFLVPVGRDDAGVQYQAVFA